MNGQHWRFEELKHYANDIVWLSRVDAQNAYGFVGDYDSKEHLGLNAKTVGCVERLEFDADVTGATEWLRARLANVLEVVVVFGEDDCFRSSGRFFIENWSDIFVSSRDDAIVYSCDSALILFYSHENEFEVGQRIVFDKSPISAKSGDS